MAIRMPHITHAKRIICQLRSSIVSDVDVPKGYLAVYVGEQEKKKICSFSVNLEPTFIPGSLSQAEEQFGFDHPMGGLTIPCREDIFIDLTSLLRGL